MRKTLVAALLIASIAPAHADVYVAVDENGNAVGGAIMCDAATCADGSEYSRLTLQPGQRYVLQGTGHAGIGNNNPNTQVKVDLQTNDWTVTRSTPTEQVVSVERFNTTGPVANPLPVQVTETKPAQSDSSTALMETATAIVETSTVQTQPVGFDWTAFLAAFKTWFMLWFADWSK